MVLIVDNIRVFNDRGDELCWGDFTEAKRHGSEATRLQALLSDATVVSYIASLRSVGLF